MAPDGIADSSLAIAAFSTWHGDHEAALAALEPDLCIAAHATVETYSVLTRLPAPHRHDGEAVIAMLGDWFPAETRVALPEDLQAKAVEELAGAGITGGAAYDALIAMTARFAGFELVTLDRRAALTYRRMGTPWRVPAGTS